MTSSTPYERRGRVFGSSEKASRHPTTSVAPTNYVYVPIDDDFMMPVKGLLNDMNTWNGSDRGYGSTGTYAVAASFDDFAALVLDNSGSVQTFKYNGTPYWTGYYMSRPAMKILHYDATRWLLSAEVFGLLAAPGNYLDPLFRQRLMQAWTDFMPSTLHDYVCGTANDEVYQLEQLPLLRLAHRESLEVAQSALQALASAIAYTRADSSRVVVANPAGVPYDGIVELAGPMPAGMQGIQFGSAATTNIVQPTSEGGAVFLAPVPSLGYVTGYFTSAPGTIPVAASVAPTTSGQAAYTLKNQYLTVVIDEASNWGIGSIQDSRGNALLKPNSIGNDLVFYTDQGDIYQFGNESGQDGFWLETVNFVVKGPGLGAVVLEQGPVRVRLRTTVTVEPTGGGPAQTYTREYMPVSGEPFLRMKTTGAANPSTSIMAAFPLARPADSITHGTACHWTDVQPYDTGSPPIFRATHRFVLPLHGSRPLGAIYHRDVPAWALTDGVLIGCLLRNTRGRDHWGAVGTDFATHTLEYAFRVFDGLDNPATGQPLREALCYTMRPAAAVPVSTSATSAGATLPETGFLASIEAPGAILAAKPGDVDTGTLVLRLYQPTNAPCTLSVTLGAGPPPRVTAVTALEDPIFDPSAPKIAVADNIVRIGAATALSTVAIMTLGSLVSDIVSVSVAQGGSIPRPLLHLLREGFVD
jgi:alpha-mannosidase